MIKIGDYLNPAAIVEMTTVSHNEIVSQLVGVCLREAPPGLRVRLQDLALQSMTMKDQGLGSGFAITHARIDEIDKIHAAAGLLPQPIRFGKWPDVHTVFCAIIPSDKANAYLGFMARLCRMLAQSGPRAAFTAGNREQVLRCLQEFDG